MELRQVIKEQNEQLDEIEHAVTRIKKNTLVINNAVDDQKM